MIRASLIAAVAALIPACAASDGPADANLAAAQITGLDFDASGAEQEQIDLAREQLYGADGLIVVGYRDYDSLGGKTRSVNRFFIKAPVPLR